MDNIRDALDAIEYDETPTAYDPDEGEGGAICYPVPPAILTKDNSLLEKTFSKSALEILRTTIPELRTKRLFAQRIRWPVERAVDYIISKVFTPSTDRRGQPEDPHNVRTVESEDKSKILDMIEQLKCFEGWSFSPIGDFAIKNEFAWSSEDQPLISPNRNIVPIGTSLNSGIIEIIPNGSEHEIYCVAVSFIRPEDLWENEAVFFIYTEGSRGIVDEIEKISLRVAEAIRNDDKPNSNIIICNNDMSLPLDTTMGWDKIEMTDEVRRNVYEDFMFFINRAEWFVRNGLPLKRGYLMVGSPGNGKCLGKGTPVLMFDGSIKKVEEIEIGDRLMGPDSMPRRVLSLANGREEMFRINPTKGDSYTVNRSHILSLVMNRPSSGHKKGAVVNISVNEYLKMSKNFLHYAMGYRVGVDFQSRPVELDPYFVGLWLGDGTRGKVEITSEEDEVENFLEQISDQFSLDLKRKPNANAGNATVYALVTPKERRRPGSNQIINLMRDLGIITGEKHIPEIYKFNDRSTRLSILAGLLDADSHLAYKCHYFVSKYEQLADDVAYLARSLGFAAYKKSTWKTCYNSKNPVPKEYWMVTLSGDLSEIPHKIPRKLSEERQQIKDVLHVGIKVESIGDGEYFGFEIDADGLFLLGDFTVTHNTLVSRAMAITPKFKAYTFDFGNPRSSTNYHLQSAFQKASRNAPSIFILEDIDRIFEIPDSDAPRMISKDALLSCLDGISTNKGVVVVATANKPELIDEALLHRPGRFDRVVRFDNPNKGMRVKFLSRLFNKSPDSNVSEEAIKIVAGKTEGCSMAFIKEIFIASAGESFEKGAGKISDDHLFAATELIMNQYNRTGTRSPGFRNR